MRFFRIALVLLCIVLLVAPLIGLVHLLLYPPPDPWGVVQDNFLQKIQSRNILVLSRNSFLLSIAVAGTSTIIGGFLAFMEHRYRYRGHSWLHILSVMPLAIPSYLIAASLHRLVQNPALQNSTLLEGFVPAWFSLVVVTTPYVQLSCGAALRSASVTEEEASRLLSPHWFPRFRVAIWPQVRSAVVFSSLICFLYAISDFGAVATLNLPVLTWELFDSIRSSDLYSASLMGAILIVLTLPILFLAQLTIMQSPRKRVANPRPPTKDPLSFGMLILAYGVHIIIIGGGLVFPISSMVLWIIEDMQRDLSFADVWLPLWDTLILSLIGAVCTIALAMAPAWESVRNPHGKYLPILIYVASALPGVLLAFTLMQSTLLITKHTGGYAFLLSSGVLLFFGYALRFLAEGFGPLFSATEQLDPRHEESAQLLNPSPQKWFSRIVFPQVRPAMLASFLLVWLAIIKELPVTLILGSALGKKTLAFHIWDRYEEAFWHDAGLGGLVLIIMALICFSLTLRWRRHV